MPARLVLLLSLWLAACASYDGRGLEPGRADTAEAEALMGAPAVRWREADGGETLVYPRGPQGIHTWFLRFDAAGRLLQRENVLDMRHFARIRPDMTPDEVVRILGPSVAHWTIRYEARNELVWEWRYCDDWNEPARFNVLFDATTLRVRSTAAATEALRGVDGIGWFRDYCSR